MVLGTNKVFFRRIPMELYGVEILEILLLFCKKELSWSGSLSSLHCVSSMCQSEAKPVTDSSALKRSRLPRLLSSLLLTHRSFLGHHDSSFSSWLEPNSCYFLESFKHPIVFGLQSLYSSLIFWPRCRTEDCNDFITTCLVTWLNVRPVLGKKL